MLSYVLSVMYCFERARGFCLICSISIAGMRGVGGHRAEAIRATGINSHYMICPGMAHPQVLYLYQSRNIMASVWPMHSMWGGVPDSSADKADR